MGIKKFLKEFGFEPTINSAILYKLKSRNIFLKLIFGISRVLGRAPFLMFKDMFYAEINPRIIELPFLFNNLPKEKGLKILDFGCAESPIPIQMATMGHFVTGSDLQKYSFRHKNFRFLRGNFLKTKLPDNYFDVVTAISSVEHCGLGSYGSPKFSDGDKRILDEARRILKKGGILILSVPFGKRYKDNFQRIYDIDALKFLVSDFKVKKERFFMREPSLIEWRETSKEILEKVSHRLDLEPGGVACLICVK